MTVAFKIPGEPFAQPRGRVIIRRSKDGRPYGGIKDPDNAYNWKATAQAHMVSAMEQSGLGKEPFSGPVRVEVVAVFTCPRSRHLKKGVRPREWHTKKPDGDNILKAVKDAAKGVLWLDDSQVVEASIAKITGAQFEAPSVSVRVITAAGVPQG